MLIAFISTIATRGCLSSRGTLLDLTDRISCVPLRSLSRNLIAKSAIDPCTGHPITKVAGSSSDLNCLCSLTSVAPHIGHFWVLILFAMDIRDLVYNSNDTSFDGLGHQQQMPDHIRGAAAGTNSLLDDIVLRNEDVFNLCSDISSQQHTMLSLIRTLSDQVKQLTEEISAIRLVVGRTDSVVSAGIEEDANVLTRDAVNTKQVSNKGPAAVIRALEKKSLLKCRIAFHCLSHGLCTTIFDILVRK